MTPESLRRFFLGFPEVTEETPFDATTVVYKTAGKMFALIDWDDKPLRVNLKCEPSQAERLRDQHACVQPGYHMNKRYWNTVAIDGSVSDDVLQSWIEHSFEQVVAKLPKSRAAELMDKRRQSPVSPPLEDPDLRESLRKGI
jgi:predicted DNA-binding protein (MmcQ/YjbR family)